MRSLNGYHCVVVSTEKQKVMIPAELIRIKRDGLALNQEQVQSFIAGVRDGSISSEQISAMAMAIWFRGLSTAEQRDLTFAIRDSGISLKWDDLPGPVVDKHSTGGVGDMVSFMAGPIVAACGGYVPMISGRGLGHTGGTLDKLESFPGVMVSPDIATFQNWVRQRGVAIIGQTPELAPADRRMYAIRDATATVDSVPLIVSSILGKKLCEGLDALVLDVKVGSGAFMPNLEDAQTLAKEICSVSRSAQVPCTALLTDMDQPMAWSAGNALEMHEVIDYFSGERRHPRLHEKVTQISAEMLRLAGLADSTSSALANVQASLDSGSAAEVFENMIAGQGGPHESLLGLARHLPGAAIIKPVFPPAAGHVRSVDVKKLGLAVVSLGGGRRQATDHVDHSVGLGEIAVKGQPVGPEESLAMVHAADENAWLQAESMILDAYEVSDEQPQSQESAILGRDEQG